MNGLLLIDKPEGCSSHDIVFQLRKKFSLPKIGHGGTLDPLASGLLIILIGKATRLAEFVIGHDKTYIVTARLGEHRDTLDADGKIVETTEIKPTISEQRIKQVFDEFPREYMQIPPAYSAKKIKGTASYKLAREGKSPNLKPCPVKIHQLELLQFHPPDIKFIAKVSSGTYIRSLVVDIATHLDTLAYVKQLRRTQSGNFDVENAYSLDEILESSKQQLKEKLLPMSCAVTELHKLILSLLQAGQFRLGQDVFLQSQYDDGVYSVFDEDNEFIGICTIRNNKIISRKVLAR